MNTALTDANAARDHAALEVLTNFGGAKETGRWLREIATIEHCEDFAESHVAQLDRAPGATGDGGSIPSVPATEQVAA